MAAYTTIIGVTCEPYHNELEHSLYAVSKVYIIFHCLAACGGMCQGAIPEGRSARQQELPMPNVSAYETTSRLIVQDTPVDR